jgi:hypothetical protein
MKRYFSLLPHVVLCSALALAAPAHAQAPPVLTFALETSTTADKQSILPKLTWSTTPAATSCAASGATDWTGAKSPAGSITLAAVTASRAYALVCNWPGVTFAVVNWLPPTTNTDGSALTDLAGFRVQYGTANNEAALSTSVYLQNPALTTWTSPALAPGSWYFGVRAFNALGLESQLSNIVSKATTAGATDQRTLTLGIKFPSAPVAE